MTDNRRDGFEVAEDKKKSSGDTEKIKSEIENLARKGELNPHNISGLYSKYKDKENIIEEMVKHKTKDYDKRKKQAREIAHKVYKKFSSGNKPFHEILDAMMKYKSDNKWTDKEYDEFRKELSYLLTGSRALEIDYNQNIATNRSRINRALGSSRIVTDEGLRIKDNEQPTLAKILEMHRNSQSLHKTVFMHSLMYEDCSLVAMTGEFKRERHIASNYIHPLIACMFLPKFDLFEMHMLYSNFGNIVKARYEKKQIVTEPDSLLYYDITSDPNDVVCEINSPLADIEKRYKVQITLWETVLKLRNGNYYEAGPISDFITVLNSCRNNIYDNTDLVYNQDEGAMLRRLMSVFSLRPTIIQTKPLYSIASYAGGALGMSMGMGMGGVFPQSTPEMNMGVGCGPGLGQFPFNNQPVYTVTSIPMITVCLPPYQANPQPIDFRISQTIWINENKTIVPKEHSIIYSKEVLIFYVNRRVQSVQIKTFSNPLAFSQLPMTMSSFERLNSHEVNVLDRITLHRVEESYYLRSVVAVTETEIVQGQKTAKIITGCTGLIMSHRHPGHGVFEPKYYLYDPFGASLPIRHPQDDGYITNKPISYIQPLYSPEIDEGTGYKNPSWIQRASQNGTIYIYAKDTGYSPYENIVLV